MPVYAVTYVYVDDEPRKDEHRPAHRAWMSERLADGTLLASGPFRTSNGALLICRAENAVTLADMLKGDPFSVEGLIQETKVEQWTNVFGPWTELD